MKYTVRTITSRPIRFIGTIIYFGFWPSFHECTVESQFYMYFTELMWLTPKPELFYLPAFNCCRANLIITFETAFWMLYPLVKSIVSILKPETYQVQLQLSLLFIVGYSVICLLSCNIDQTMALSRGVLCSLKPRLLGRYSPLDTRDSYQGSRL